MPRLFRRMKLVHVAPPSGQPMVPLPHEEHLTHKVDKIEVGGHPCIESFILKLLQRTPGGRDVLRDHQDVVLVVVDENIENTLTISVLRNEFVLQPLDIQLVDGPNEWQIPQAAEGDAKSRLLKRPNVEAMMTAVESCFCFARRLTSLSSGLADSGGSSGSLEEVYKHPIQFSTYKNNSTTDFKGRHVQERKT